MKLFRRASPSSSTTPVFDTSIRPSIVGTIIRAMILPVAIVGSLAWFGQPALRIEYQWYGVPEHPTCTGATYLALDGWHHIRPVHDFNQCPLVIFVPLDLTDFLLG